ncbi:MAG: TonB-dependent receptor [Chitinophagales bacterium]|nr:TonB-dependent receptor [Chitinophagaceae bacterium]MCB9064075.1 TonB-dependent receptor [Chitinophagales bacterium]
MLNKKVYAIFVFVLAAFTLQAQSIRVTVQDKNNGETVPFAYIHISSAQNNSVQNTVQTDENGVANIIPEGYPFTIEINALGFEPLKKSFYAAPAGKTVVIYMAKKYSTMNEVVVTGLSQASKQKDALSVYRVITKEQIKAQGAVTLDDVMKNQLNVRVSNDNVLGANMRMQGMSGDKVKILVDGIPLNGREGGNINLSQINMNNVDRIEIIQGPMSVVYGTDALGGVINIITKTPKKPFEVNAGVYYGSLGNYNFDASVTKRYKERHQFTIGGGRNRFIGWKPIEQYKIYLDDTLQFSRSKLFKPNEQYIGNFAYAYTAPSGFRAGLASDFLQETVTNKGNLELWQPTGAYAFDEYYHTTRSTNRLSFNGKLGKKGTWQSQNGYVIYYRTRNAYVKDMVTLEETLNQGQGTQDTSSFNDVFARGSYSNSLSKLDYTVGYDVNLQYASSLKITGKNKQIQDYAVYTNISMPVLKDKMRLQLGLRAAMNSTYNPPLIPSFNVLYKPVKKVQIRASYAKGYRAPSLKEMYLSFIDLNHYIIGNEGLDAESGHHAQLSASYQAYEKGNDYLQFIVTGFYNDVYNGITLAPIDPNNPTSIKYTYANLSHQSNGIASLQADGQRGNIHYQLGYSYNYTFADPGNYSAFSASEATATLQYYWKKPKIGFNTFYKFTGKQPFLQSNIDGSASYNGTQQPFHICDASIERKFFDRKLQITAGVKNIFNFQQATVSGRTSSGTHGGGVASFLPRSIFTSVRLVLD